MKDGALTENKHRLESENETFPKKLEQNSRYHIQNQALYTASDITHSICTTLRMRYHTWNQELQGIKYHKQPSIPHIPSGTTHGSHNG